MREDGTFGLAVDGNDASTRLTITAKSFATDRVNLEVAGAAEWVQEFTLRPERSLLVRVEDAGWGRRAGGGGAFACAAA